MITVWFYHSMWNSTFKHPAFSVRKAYVFFQNTLMKWVSFGCHLTMSKCMMWHSATWGNDLLSFISDDLGCGTHKITSWTQDKYFLGLTMFMHLWWCVYSSCCVSFAFTSFPATVVHLHPLSFEEYCLQHLLPLVCWQVYCQPCQPLAV